MLSQTSGAAISITNKEIIMIKLVNIQMDKLVERDVHLGNEVTDLRNIEESLSA